MNSHCHLLDYGITIGTLPTGRRNQITDVPGVRVGHCTIDTDRHKTGVTVIIPAEGNLYARPVVAAAHVINGFGKTAGLMQVQELGTLETPIVLTGTLNVGKMHDALVSYTLEQCAADGVLCRSVNPVVGETNDGTLSAGADRPAGAEHLRAAMAEARQLSDSGACFAEGDVGAGKGTVCLGLKGGIGSASRVMDIGGQCYTLGVLVQTNFGCIEDLRMDGLPLGEAVLAMVAEEGRADEAASRGAPVTGQDDIGSIMIIVGTDLPVNDRQLTRILRRATVGLARTGSHIGHGSGDVVIGFTTANRQEAGAADMAVRTVRQLREDCLEAPFRAVAECVEEAILHSLLAADTVVGFDGAGTVTVRALSEFLPEAVERARGMVGR